MSLSSREASGAIVVPGEDVDTHRGLLELARALPPVAHPEVPVPRVRRGPARGLGGGQGRGL